MSNVASHVVRLSLFSFRAGPLLKFGCRWHFAGRPSLAVTSYGLEEVGVVVYDREEM